MYQDWLDRDRVITTTGNTSTITIHPIPKDCGKTTSLQDVPTSENMRAFDERVAEKRKREEENDKWRNEITHNRIASKDWDVPARLGWQIPSYTKQAERRGVFETQEEAIAFGKLKLWEF